MIQFFLVGRPLHHTNLTDAQLYIDQRLLQLEVGKIFNDFGQNIQYLFNEKCQNILQKILNLIRF